MIEYNFANIPNELKTLTQWVCWKKELRDGKETKIPYIPNTQNKASVDDPTTWTNYETALNGFINYDGDGIGFVFTVDDPFTFIDLDHCVDESIINTESKKIADQLNSYSEISQSGSGLHIIVRGVLLDGSRKRKDHVEIYSKGRYAVMTGAVFNGYPSTIMERQKELEQVYQEVFGDLPQERKEPIKDKPTIEKSDQEIIEMARKAKNSQKFNKLFYAGEISDYDNDDSRADLALCAEITFWTRDPAQIDRIFRQSKLYREKWERSDYRSSTIDAALNMVSNSYNDKYSINTANDISSDKPVKFYKLTDYGNAERLVYYHGENIRYCEPMKSWFIWDGKRWKVDDSLAIERLAKDTVRKIYFEAGICEDENIRKQYIKHIKESESSYRQHAMVSMARSEAGVIIRPDELNRNGYLLNCENGTVDLRTGELQPHRKEDYITKLVNIKYDTSADAPRWERFLDEIFLGDHVLTKYLKYCIGYSLTDSIKEQCFFICYGVGANGKSVFLDTIESLTGEYGKRVNPTTFEDMRANSGAREDIAGLKQIRYISTIETGQGKRLAENLIKQMTGDTTIRARFLYQNSFEFSQSYKIWIATNNKPAIYETTDAIWRRVRLIPFEFVVEPEKQNKNLVMELREELSGILNWAVEGCINWHGIGLDPVTPEKVKRATNDYRQESNTIESFISETCVKGNDKTVGVKELHKAFIEYSGFNISRKLFTQKMIELGYKTKRFVNGIFWENIDLM